MVLEKLLELLNTDLSLEYMAIVQYVQHRGAIGGAGPPRVGEMLAEHAGEELEHAFVLAEQIARLGGTPTVKVIKARTGTDLETRLRQDLKGERDAVERYRQRIAQAADLGMDDLEGRLRQILAMEERHQRNLEQIIVEREAD